MKKIIIPRKDHEVYFIPRPESVKNKKELERYITEKMEKLHPAFSLNSQIDSKLIIINNSHWLMLTIMEESVLAEYRILNQNALLFTNTSIKIHRKDFLHDGIRTIDDEKIGFDTVKNEPVSFPLDSSEFNSPQKLQSYLQSVSMRSAVFKKKLPAWSIFAAGLSLLLVLLALLFARNGLEKSNRQLAVILPDNSEQFTQIDEPVIRKHIPPSIEILAAMAVDIFNTRGRILHWQYNEDGDPFMIIQLQGIDLVSVYRIFGEYKFIQLQDIQEIRYGDNEPYITVFLNANKAEYITSTPEAFPLYDFTFPMITELSGALKAIDVSMLAETLPAAGNSYLHYSISFSAVDWNLIRALENIAHICEKYSLQVKNLDISISGNRFFASCTLAYCNTVSHSTVVLGNEKYYIPLAFGYTQEENSVIVGFSTDGTENVSPVIGSIRDTSGKTVFYRDTADGKIQVRVEND